MSITTRDFIEYVVKTHKSGRKISYYITGNYGDMYNLMFRLANAFKEDHPYQKHSDMRWTWYRKESVVFVDDLIYSRGKSNIINLLCITGQCRQFVHDLFEFERWTESNYWYENENLLRNQVLFVFGKVSLEQYARDNPLHISNSIESDVNYISGHFKEVRLCSPDRVVLGPDPVLDNFEE